MEKRFEVKEGGDAYNKITDAYEERHTTSARLCYTAA